ncbi:hypothetical protein FHS83_001522 [Rhizomicrobium palustre]|uniref:DUF2147 domain-containing protein n=1 Tax=Rhizomicrobium palustre TaxID=189966 RepID=A0A846MXB8_9PROT|nr:hypothetical protein [Rhizomicrobium palustre]NIK88204.1 hypothetical protein [Rhizomicrobium palustre]
MMFRSAFLALALTAGAAEAATEDFLGHWQNPDPKGSGLTHLAVTPNGGNGVDLRAYGDCRAIECDWGIVQGKVYTASPKSTDVQVVEATFHFGFAHRHITLRKDASGKLRFDMLIELADNSARHDYAVSGVLKKTSWVGPVTQVWQNQPGLQTGWGGGARSVTPPSPDESCTMIDTTGARAVAENGYWFVKAKGKVIVDVGKDEKTAMLAEAALRHYKFDRRCTSGGPFKSYWKSASGFATDKMAGAICLKFQPTTAHLIRSSNSWKIVDGADTLVDLGVNKKKADAMLGLIRANRLNAECFIRYPDPVMSFWLSTPAVP